MFSQFSFLLVNTFSKAEEAPQTDDSNVRTPVLVYLSPFFTMSYPVNLNIWQTTFANFKTQKAYPRIG
ncbi:hypothetical protein CMK22_03680 [Candidatus Poribacteria bacterium]|nr:hypothetical protein [Candidatus Poribacteria bacterium]